MKLALNLATLIKLSTWSSDFVSASVQRSFANDRWRFSPFVTIKLHSISSAVTFQADNSHLVILLSRLECKNCTWFTQTLQLTCKVNGTPEQVDSSLDLLISLKVLKSTRWEDSFLFLVLFLLLSLCVRNVGKAYPRPLLHRKCT